MERGSWRNSLDGRRKLGVWGTKKIPETVVDAEGNVQYRCEVCKKLFNKNYNLRAHSRLHTGERPFQCTAPGCNKSFLWKSSLTSHRVAHEKDNRQTARQEFVIQPEEGPVATSMDLGDDAYASRGGRNIGRRHSEPVHNFFLHSQFQGCVANDSADRGCKSMPESLTMSHAFSERDHIPQANSAPVFQQQLGKQRGHARDFRPQQPQKSLNRFAPESVVPFHAPRRGGQLLNPFEHSLAAAMLELEAVIKPSLQASLSPPTSPRDEDYPKSQLRGSSPWPAGAQTHEIRHSPLMAPAHHQPGPAAWLESPSLAERRTPPQTDDANKLLPMDSHQNMSQPEQPCSGRMPPRPPIAGQPQHPRAPFLNLAVVPPSTPQEIDPVTMMFSPDITPYSCNSYSGNSSAANTSPGTAASSSIGTALDTLASLDLAHLTNGKTYMRPMGSPNMAGSFDAGLQQMHNDDVKYQQDS